MRNVLLMNACLEICFKMGKERSSLELHSLYLADVCALVMFDKSNVDGYKKVRYHKYFLCLKENTSFPIDNYSLSHAISFVNNKLKIIVLNLSFLRYLSSGFIVDYNHTSTFAHFLLPPTV